MNKQRSKTAQDYFSQCYKAKHYEFKSAGTNHKLCKEANTTPITEDLMIWADLVLVMETHHRNIINNYTQQRFDSKIRTLDIPDIFQYYQQELIEILVEKASVFLD